MKAAFMQTRLKIKSKTCEQGNDGEIAVVTCWFVLEPRLYRTSSWHPTPGPTVRRAPRGNGSVSQSAAQLQSVYFAATPAHTAHISPQPYKLPITVSSLMPADGLRCKAAQTARRPRPIRIILWTTTALLHCAPLFFHLGVDLAEGLLAACVGLAQLAQLKPQVAALTLDRGEVVLEPLGAPLE